MKLRADHIEVRKLTDNMPEQDLDVLLRADRAYLRCADILYKDIITVLWEQYLNGEWRRERPCRPGLYPVANNQRNVVGEAKFIEDNGVVKPVEDKWATGNYWFWSTPRPVNMPVRPPEYENNTKEVVLRGKKIPWLRIVVDEAVNN